MRNASEPYWDPAIETVNADALETIRADRLRWQVQRCYEQSALYRRKLSAVGAEPGDIRGAADLGRIPVVTKQELREDQAKHPPFGSFLVAERAALREIHPSTGTTGAPVVTAWSANDVETITDFTARTMWQFGVRPNDVVQNAFAYGLWVAGMSTHYASARLGCFVIPTGATTATDKQIQFLQSMRSTVLLATPSFALRISERLAELGMDPEELDLGCGCFGGEPGGGQDATREKLEAGLGIRAYDYYGLAEVGPTFASECEAQAGSHFAEDHVLVECVDPDTHMPVSDGELGVLVFTHLTREATPVLRYWSNDYARLCREPCECGRTHVRAIGGIVGRHDDLVIFKGAKFYPSQVEHIVRRFDGVGDEFLIEIVRAGRDQPLQRCVVAVEVVADESRNTAERLRDRFRSELGVTPEVRLVPYGSLPRTAFKAQRIVESQPA